MYDAILRWGMDQKVNILLNIPENQGFDKYF